MFAIDILETFKTFLTPKRKLKHLKTETILVTGSLSSIKVYWVSLNMIKDHKSFLKLKYISENDDLQHEKFKVKEITWINFGIREQPDDRGNLKVVHHPDCAFVHFTIDPKQQPNLVL